MSEDAVCDSGGFSRATLVVCPLVAVLQWRQEIERFTPPNTLKVSPLRSDGGKLHAF